MTGPKEPVAVLRRACDRCHGQKLSCQRDGNDSSRPCTRCLRADTLCSTSLSQRNRRNQPFPSAMSTPAATPTRLKRLRGRQSGGVVDYNGGFARNHLVERPDHTSDADAVMDAENIHKNIQTGSANPGAGAMDWISFDWENGYLNPFSVADFDPSSRPTTPNTLARFVDPLQHLGVAAPLTNPASARDAGDPIFGLGDEAGPTPRPPSVHSISISNTSGNAAPGCPPQSDGQWLQRLVEINMQLFDHANKAKAKVENSGPASELSSDNEASSTILRPPGFNNFDETIVLSFYLVKALHGLYPPESLKIDQRSSLPVGPPHKLDSGTMLTIFSCYVRMLDLFMDRLGALRSALNNTTTSLPTADSSLGSTTTPSFPPSQIFASNGLSPGFDPSLGSGHNNSALLLPTLVACGCPLEGYPVLRLRMTLELVEEILEVTSALVTPIVHGIGDSSQSGQSNLMLVVSPQALSTREQAAYRIIKDVRVHLRRHRRIMVI